MAANTASLENVFRANERTSASLEIMQVVLAGSLAFQVIDRVTGGWTVLKTEWGISILKFYLLDQMMAMFGLSLFTWWLLGTGLVRFLAYLKRMAVGIIQHKANINQPLNMANYQKFITTRQLEDEDIDIDGTEKYRKLSWREPPAWRWRGDPPQVDVTIDETNGFLVKYFLQYNKNRGRLRGYEVSDIFMEILRENGLIPLVPRPRNPRPADDIEVKFEKTETQELDMDAPISTLSFLGGADTSISEPLLPTEQTPASEAVLQPAELPTTEEDVPEPMAEASQLDVVEDNGNSKQHADSKKIKADEQRYNDEDEQDFD